MNALKDMCANRTKLHAMFQDGDPLEDFYVVVHSAPDENGEGVLLNLWDTYARRNVISYRIEKDGQITGWLRENDPFRITVFFDEESGEVDCLKFRFADGYTAQFVACTCEYSSPQEEIDGTTPILMGIALS